MTKDFVFHAYSVTAMGVDVSAQKEDTHNEYCEAIHGLLAKY